VVAAFGIKRNVLSGLPGKEARPGARSENHIARFEDEVGTLKPDVSVVLRRQTRDAGALKCNAL